LYEAPGAQALLDEAGGEFRISGHLGGGCRLSQDLDGYTGVAVAHPIYYAAVHSSVGFVFFTENSGPAGPVLRGGIHLSIT